MKSVLAYYLDGTLLKWCRANQYGDLADRLTELNPLLITNLYNNLGIQLGSAELERFTSQSYESSRDYIEFAYHKTEKNRQYDQFAKSCIKYLSKQMNIAKYDVDLHPTGLCDETAEYWEFEMYEYLTDMEFRCIIPKSESEEYFMKTLFYIVEHVISISVLTDDANHSSCSGGFGYGLELI